MPSATAAPIFELDNRIKIFTNLRMEKLDRLALKRRLDEIGTIRVPDSDVADPAQPVPRRCTALGRP